MPFASGEDPGMRMLIVEHEPGVGEALAKRLAARNHACHFVTGVAEASDYLARHRCDLVLVEYLLGDEDASVLLRSLKKPPFRRDPTDGIAVVAMSAGSYAMPANFILNMARKLGADAVLEKPFTDEQLFAAVAAATKD